MFGKRRNQRWPTLTGSTYKISHISASIHDINEIPTAIPMFSRSGNTTTTAEWCCVILTFFKWKHIKPLDVIKCVSSFCRQLWFLPFPHIEHFSEKSSRVRVARCRKHGCSRWNFVSIMYRSRDMRYFSYLLPVNAAIFDLSPIRTSGILRSTSVVLPDLENIGI